MVGDLNDECSEGLRSDRGAGLAGLPVVEDNVVSEQVIEQWNRVRRRLGSNGLALRCLVSGIKRRARVEQKTSHAVALEGEQLSQLVLACRRLMRVSEARKRLVRYKGKERTKTQRSKNAT